MKTETWELIKTVTVTYDAYTDFDLPIILKEYNEKCETNYTLEDIEDIRIKWNEIHLIMNDQKEISYDWILPDTDYKRPNEVEYNLFDSEINNEE